MNTEAHIQTHRSTGTHIHISPKFQWQKPDGKSQGSEWVRVRRCFEGSYRRENTQLCSLNEYNFPMSIKSKTKLKSVTVPSSQCCLRFEGCNTIYAKSLAHTWLLITQINSQTSLPMEVPCRGSSLCFSVKCEVLLGCSHFPFQSWHAECRLFPSAKRTT